MKYLVCAALGLLMTACSEAPSKSGVMPGVATGGYDAPKNHEAALSYMAGFKARYDIPELDYPEEIKARIRQARHAQFVRDMEIARKRTEMMSKPALSYAAQNDPEAKKLLKKLKDNPKAKPNKTEVNQLISLADNRPRREILSKSEREKIYKGALREYKSDFRTLKIESCRWTELERLIGTGHEQMAFIHGTHPTHGYRCEVALKTEQNKGYPRVRNFSAFWVKLPSGKWAYYGKFYGVGISPRQQRLNPDLLKDPEGTIMRQTTWDSVAGSFQ